MINFLQQISC